MTDEQAMRVLSPLVALTGGWDDPKVELWVHKLGGLERPDWATEAIDLIIDTHTAIGAPPWAKVLEAYQATARRHPAYPHNALPPGTGMRLDDYLAKLKLNAAGGSTAARDELEDWERLAARHRPEGAPNWIAALR